MDTDIRRKKYLEYVNKLKKLLEFSEQRMVEGKNNVFESLDGSVIIDMEEYRKAELEYFETFKNN